MELLFLKYPNKAFSVENVNIFFLFETYISEYYYYNHILRLPWDVGNEKPFSTNHSQIIGGE